MGILGLQAIYPTSKRVTLLKNSEHKIYPYLLKEYWTTVGKTQQVQVDTPNEVWSGDISYEHTQMLIAHNIQISMNGKGRSIDNIAIERFFRTLKHGNVYISSYKPIKGLKEGVKAYIHK